MTEVETTYVAQGEIPCRDPDCPGLAEVEQDGDFQYFVCDECQFEFGHKRIGFSQDDCAIGVPEEVRRVASAPYEEAMRKEQGQVIAPSLGFRE